MSDVSVEKPDLKLSAKFWWSFTWRQYLWLILAWIIVLIIIFAISALIALSGANREAAGILGGIIGVILGIGAAIWTFKKAFAGVLGKSIGGHTLVLINNYEYEKSQAYEEMRNE